MLTTTQDKMAIIENIARSLDTKEAYRIAMSTIGGMAGVYPDVNNPGSPDLIMELVLKSRGCIMHNYEHDQKLKKNLWNAMLDSPWSLASRTDSPDMHKFIKTFEIVGNEISHDPACK